MLSLTRKVGQSIIIGDNDIVIRVNKILTDGQVSLTIMADKAIPINREEIYLSKKKDGVI